MNKEEYAIDEKTYENYDGLKIKIIFSNLGRRYKKIGDNLSLMLEKKTVKLEDSLTAMIRITKEIVGRSSGLSNDKIHLWTSSISAFLSSLELE